MKNTLIITLTFVCSFVLAQNNTIKNSKAETPKVVETPIHIIELDGSKLPATTQAQTIFQCNKGKIRVYVDKVKSGLTDCQRIDQKELTKFQPPLPESNSTQIQPSKQPKRIQPTTTLVRPNLQGQQVQQAQQTRVQNQYRPPCTGMITYKGKNYLLPNDKPCPIPDTILLQLRPIPN